MFTGIIEATGRIAALEQKGGDARIYVHTGNLGLSDMRLGDSIAVNGVCLTAVSLPGDGFWADVSGETLTHTTLGELRAGSEVNLEKALMLQARLGGHLVSGHVDGAGILEERYKAGRSERLHVRAPAELAKYIAEKGSICVDGISLTVNRVRGAAFELNIVPHTLEMTNLHSIKVGQRLNLEVDLIARYVERLLLKDAAAGPESGPESCVSREFLAENGFLSDK
ncbi:MAG: riboflavin synthase [Gammaproteobacteria bacterium]|nr:riboflavin synthase [Gammaproteobacteria bacterium]